ncbi:hypothetical protein ACQEVB_33815 [Pseudonocardia sp. CA-107938]|uniref:hypothetical protein n=1 Tax=Pseudonocardia sp. CA-107938 TaxID=3240021 RepID=UPI003D8F474B
MDRVVWRLEIPAGWGERLDPAWLPNEGTDGWREVFAGEDYAARVFASGGAGIPWKVLAQAAARLAEVLQHYRAQWRCAEAVASGCPVAADAHVAAMAVPRGLRAPRRTRPDGPWRVCVLDDGVPATVAEHLSIDLAEGAACAHRTGAADQAWWAEPVAAGPAPDRAAASGWLPIADTELRLSAFAAEEAVADLTAAAATGHLGPDVLEVRLVCTLGEAAHHMIREYRTLFAAVWTDLEACAEAATHDADASALLESLPPAPERGPGGRWHHMHLVGGRAKVVNRHLSRTAAAASVAASRAIDDTTVRWAEPAARTAARG